MKKQLTPDLLMLMRLLVLLAVGCVLLAACKKEPGLNQAKTKAAPDPGIHEAFKRGPATATLDIDRKEITIAQRIHLAIGITVDEDDEVKLPAFGEKLEQFGIVDYHTTQPKLTADNRKTVKRFYVLEPFLSGDYTIPPMEITFWKKGETKVHKITTRTVSIKVTSLLPEDLKKVKLNEIEPPVPFPSAYPLWLWVGIGVGVVSAGTGLIIFIIKRRNRKGRPQIAQPAAHELAYEALYKLAEEDLISKGEIKRYYQRISDIMRRYIENRFRLRASEQTTEEFLAGLKETDDFPEQHKVLLKTFLRHCDLVKFAAHLPTDQDIQSTYDSCKAFIRGTKKEV